MKWLLAIAALVIAGVVGAAYMGLLPIPLPLPGAEDKPVGKEVARHVHDGTEYVIVDYEGQLAVFSASGASGAAVSSRSVADAVLLSYSWRKALDDFDADKLADAARTVRDIDDQVSEVREYTGEVVAVFDELDGMGADVPLLGRVSAMDAVREYYAGVGEAESLIRSLDSELGSFGDNAVALTRASERVEGVQLASVSGAEMERLFGDAADAARDLVSTASNLNSQVSRARDAAGRLESALRDASDTPLIGGVIGGFADSASRLESELSGVQDALGGFESEVSALGRDLRGAMDSANSARQSDMARWIGEPYDASWPPSDPGRRSAAAKLPAAAPAVARAPVPAATATAVATSTAVPTATATATATPGPTGRIAFYIYDWDGETARNRRVVVMNPDGTGEKRIMDILEGGGGSVVSKSPDGSRLAVASDGGLYVIDSDGTDGERLTDFEYRVIGRIGGSWSPDGSRIAFVANTEEDTKDRLYVIDVDGAGEMRQVASNPRRRDSPLSWSPDGSRIAFDCIADGICAANSDGRGGVTVFRTGYDARNPTWSPDGQQILFFKGVYVARGWAGSLLVRNSDGTGLVGQFVDAQAQFHAWQRWSPDGRRIAFACDEDSDWEFHVCVANADGSGLMSLGTPRPESFDWSPDGRWIAYSVRERGIYVIRSDGGGQLVRISDHERAYYLNWLPE